MSIAVNKDGKLIIETEYYGMDAAEALIRRRQAIMDLITERNTDFIDTEPIYHGIEMLRELEFNYEQVKQALNNNTSTKKN